MPLGGTCPRPRLSPGSGTSSSSSLRSTMLGSKSLSRGLLATCNVMHWSCKASCRHGVASPVVYASSCNACIEVVQCECG